MLGFVLISDRLFHFLFHNSLLENSRNYVFTSGKLSLVFVKTKGRDLSVKLIRLANKKM